MLHPLLLSYFCKIYTCEATPSLTWVWQHIALFCLLAGRLWNWKCCGCISAKQPGMMSIKRMICTTVQTEITQHVCGVYGNNLKFNTFSIFWEKFLFDDFLITDIKDIQEDKGLVYSFKLILYIFYCTLLRGGGKSLSRMELTILYTTKGET